MESYLVFTYDPLKPKTRVVINDKNNQYLGALEKIRVGAWMTWCLTDVPDTDIYFSASCLDEIRKKVKELNGKKNG